MAKKTSKADRASRQREMQQAAAVRHGHDARRRVLRIGLGAILALIVLVAAFIYYGRSGGSAGSAQAASATLGSLTASRPPSATGSFQRVSGVLRRGHEPVFLFVGAQYCPFCAAERWAIVKALSRFGRWSNLSTGHSTSGEAGFSGVPTFDLLHARYSSPYVRFDSKDVADNAGAKLQTLAPWEQAAFNRYDTSGSIPLVYVDGYAMTGSGYSPAEVQGNSFSEIQRQLQGNGSAAYVHDINGEANLLTAFVCRADGNRPGQTCRQAVIQTIERGIR